MEQETENKERPQDSGKTIKANKKQGEGSLEKETIKNSGYSMINTVVSKAGGLILTIVLARVLLPELYGIYNLVLSIILLVGALVDKGPAGTIVRYVSGSLGQEGSGGRKKARSYFRYISKIKGILLGVGIFLLVVFAKFIANNIFEKPEIYYPLLASCLFLLMKGFNQVISPLFIALKDFKKVTITTSIFHFFRILFPLLGVFILTGKSMVTGVFIGLAIAAFLGLIVRWRYLGKNKDLIKGKTEKIDKKRVNNYLFYISISVISVTFFASVDTLMLGRVVSAEYLGYYRAALNLVLAVAALFAFGGVLFPVFSRLGIKSTEKGVKKAMKYVLMVSVPATLGIAVIAKSFIVAIYGPAYEIGMIPLYALSLIIFIMPVGSIFGSLLKSKERVKTLSRIIIYSLLLNIVLNFVFIKYLPVWFNKGPEFAILGAGIATVISRGYFLVMRYNKVKKELGIKPKFTNLGKYLISGILMSVFLISFVYAFEMNLILGGINILLGIVVYFGFLYGLGGLDKEDIDLFKGIFNEKMGKMFNFNNKEKSVYTEKDESEYKNPEKQTN